jgi:glycogen debranching enzyme
VANEIISVSENFYVLSTSQRIDDRVRVLKSGDTFAVFDRFGDIERFGGGELGLYHRDTRFLSVFTLAFERVRPLLLSSSVKEDNALLAVDLMNSDLLRGDEVVVPRGTLHIFRSKTLWRQGLYQRLRLHNYGAQRAELNFAQQFAADFADIFEVRGMQREKRGRALPAKVEGSSIVLGYQGLDRRVRLTRIHFDPPPNRLSESEAQFTTHLEPGNSASYFCAIECELLEDERANEQKQRKVKALSYEKAAQNAARALKAAREEEPEIFTSNERLNDWLNRSLADLHMMGTETPFGPYPYAGVPWFSTAFGRDGIITALQCLWFNPSLARGVLTYLAATQAETENAEQDAEPGKILHETRGGEMAALGEVPFGRYYGSIDSTPLFVMLAGAYHECTNDLEFARSIWPHVQRALDWIDHFGDRDGDGFVEYARRSPHGLVQQGWKDSVDSVFHENGEPAEGPIALCEVQGYVYAAKIAAAALSRVLGDNERAARLTNEAKALQEQFEQKFWCEDLSTYALALDGQKRPCRVVSSNAGHCLFAGIAGPARARRVAASLTNEDCFSGWGIRTIGVSAARYNPMSYHNGSVWPHDNSLIAAGFARYGLQKECARVLSGLLDASLFFELHRLPELFCGFERRAGEGPTLYPVACNPQAWAAGAVFLLLQSTLGLTISARDRRLGFSRRKLPGFMRELQIRRLQVGDTSIDLSICRSNGETEVTVLRKTSDLEIIAYK